MKPKKVSNVLVVYYSRTGATRKLAEKIAKMLDSDIAEITDDVKREGVLGYLKSGKDAVQKVCPPIKFNGKPENYDVVIIATPVWASTMASPVRSFITDYRSKIKKAAYVCTLGGNSPEKTLSRMADLCGKESVATFSVRTKDIEKADVTEFIRKLAS